MPRFGIPFVDQVPTAKDIQKIRLAMSTFRDGSGQEREIDGTTRPGWRELERVVVEVLGGIGTENKNVFDVIVPENTAVDIGVSVKSKALSASKFQQLTGSGRLYIELCNSSTILWDGVHKLGLFESDFREKRHAATIGESLIKTVESWHQNAATQHQQQTGRLLNLEKSIFFVITYGPFSSRNHRLYQLHSFDLKLPKKITWSYVSEKCLGGFDQDHPDEKVMDWYGLSGGQLKYYPRASNARFVSTVFSLLNTEPTTILKKAKMIFPDEWDRQIGE